MKEKSKIGIIGGGIIGLTIAYKLKLKFPKSDIYLFEKESGVGAHQSGNNSGVLHCGLHYLPGSLKARLSVNGVQQMIAFCRDNDIDHELCGKIVVATNNQEISGINELARRGERNGLRGLKFLNKTELKSSLYPSAFIANAQKMIPDLRDFMFEKKGTAGVRAQAITEEGSLLNDFKIIKEDNQVHVLNAPSPGATASFAIADYLIENYV